MRIGRAIRAASALALVLALGLADARGDVQVEPLARVTLEGGYDSNVLYNGQGGDSMGRLSPDLGVRLRDHTWWLDAAAGGDLLFYRERRNDPVWNQRGRAVLHARLTPRLTLDSNLQATYARDPIGLARLGIFGRTGAAFVGNGTARLGWELEHRWGVAGTFAHHSVVFDARDGAASYSPGVEVTRRLDARTELGGAYRFDYFQGFGTGAHDALAHELLAVLRRRLTRRLALEAEAGPALWVPRYAGGSTELVPEAALQLLYAARRYEGRLTLRHGVGLGNLATPGLVDIAEGAFRIPLGRSFEVVADGGLWRSGNIPWGANGALGYGIEGEVAWLLGGGLRLGVGGSRFARADAGVTTYDRNTVGLRLGWELRHR